MEDAPLFRASKRRKANSKAESRESQSVSGDESTPGLVKSRHQLKARPRGVHFSNNTSLFREQDDPTSTGLAIGGTNGRHVSLAGLQSRFVRSGSGRQTVNVDKHTYVHFACIAVHFHVNAPRVDDLLRSQARPVKQDSCESPSRSLCYFQGQSQFSQTLILI